MNLGERVYNQAEVDWMTKGHTCQHCGKQHHSDDTELWCLVAKKEKEKPTH